MKSREEGDGSPSEAISGTMTSVLSLAAGVAVGATAMYFWDPNRGKTRRAHLADYTRSRVNRCQTKTAGAAEDLFNRAKGAVAKAGTAFSGAARIDDATLADSVRSRMGHITRHAHNLETSVLHGIVTLRGRLEDELERRRLVDAVAETPGVQSIEVHWSPASGA